MRLEPQRLNTNTLPPSKTGLLTCAKFHRRQGALGDGKWTRLFLNSLAVWRRSLCSPSALLLWAKDSLRVSSAGAESAPHLSGKTPPDTLLWTRKSGQFQALPRRPSLRPCRGPEEPSWNVPPCQSVWCSQCKGFWGTCCSNRKHFSFGLLQENPVTLGIL